VLRKIKLNMSKWIFCDRYFWVFHTVDDWKKRLTKSDFS